MVTLDNIKLHLNIKDDVTDNDSAAQQVERKVYRNAYTVFNDLVHTKLEVKVDWIKKYLYGKATITLHPHFYPTDSLILNARGMKSDCGISIQLFFFPVKRNFKLSMN